MATSTKMIHARIDGKLKADAEAVFSELGMTMTDAIKIFLAQATHEQALPFKPHRVAMVREYADGTRQVVHPNKRLRKTLRDADAGIGLSRSESAEALFKELGI